MRIRSNVLHFTLAMTTVLLQSMAFAAPVESTSLEVFKDTETPYWEVSVNCSGLDTPRTMTKGIEAKEWCSSEVISLCNENKFLLSQQLCDNDASQHVSSSTSDVALDEPLETQQENELDLVSASVNKESAKAVKVDTKNTNTTQKIDRDSLIREQIQIEEQRILIEQKRLELRRLELALEKDKFS